MSENPGGFNFEQLRKMLEQMGIDPAAMGMNLEDLMAQAAKLGQQGGFMFGMTPADQDPDAAWRTTITAARNLVKEKSPDTALRPDERSAVIDAERLVQSWLDAQTSFAAPSLPAQPMLREEWLEVTGDGWRGIVEPIIDGLAAALERGADAEVQGEFGGFAAMLGPMMRTSASMMYRDRLKRVLADVAADILTGTELGINLLPFHQVRLLTGNLAEFTKDLEASESDMLLVLLLREAARQRLFAHVTWLSPQVNALLAHYAREIRIDLDAIASQIDPSMLENASMEDIMAVGERVRGSFFQPASTPQQLEILGRLEVLLALIDGWVDHVVSAVTDTWMPNAGGLLEIMRRRRASGGPTQQVFSDLLGLDLRPRLVRDAQNLWAAVEHRRGLEGRDQVWRHPDLLPTAEQLADPLAFAAGDDDSPSQVEDEMDRELRKLLEGGQ